MKMLAAGIISFASISARADDGTVRAGAASGEVTALVGCTLWPGDGPKVDGATVVFSASGIVAAGAGASVPAGARTLDVKGRVCTPGLVDAASHLGAVEVDYEASTVDVQPAEGKPYAPIHADFLPADGLNLASALVAIARAGGLTAVALQPEGGIVAGRGTLFELFGTTPAEAVVVPVTAVYAVLGEGAKGGYGGARGHVTSRLREALDDARDYARRKADYEKGQVPRWRERRASLEALALVLAGKLPLVVQASRASDLLEALALAKEYGLRLVLEGAEEGWLVADALARAKVPVIVHGMANAPESFASLAERYENAGLLSKAGVKVALTALGGAADAHTAGTLRQQAGVAVANGMEWSAALRAITRTPAELFGADKLGLVAPGMTADVVVWSGDPLELSTRPEHVFVRGVEQSLRTRQTALFEKYRTLPPRP